MKNYLFLILLIVSTLFVNAQNPKPVSKSKSKNDLYESLKLKPKNNGTDLYESLKLKPIKNFVKTKYVKPLDDKYSNWYEGFKEEKFLEQMATLVNDVFKFDKPLTLILDECGRVNAFYNSEDRTVTICYELLSMMEEFYRETVPDDTLRGKKVGNALSYIFFHEIGHALIDMFDLPITAREEDAADYFAFYILGSNDVDEGVTACMEGANFFMDTYNKMVTDSTYLELKKQGKEPELPFWDEHSLGIQRFYNIACLLYGSNPEKYDYFIEKGYLGERRPNIAIQEYKRIKKGWDRLLYPYIKWK